MKEFTELIESGFEFVKDYNNLKVCRKSKRTGLNDNPLVDGILTYFNTLAALIFLFGLAIIVIVVLALLGILR